MAPISVKTSLSRTSTNGSDPESQLRGETASQTTVESGSPPRRLQDLTPEEFHTHLDNYSEYVVESYKEFEEQRFVTIPSTLRAFQGRHLKWHLTKDQLLGMDRWMRKRGTVRAQSGHEEITTRIEANGRRKVEEISSAAFHIYQNDLTSTEGCSISVQGALNAMEKLQELEGVDMSMASLLLSVAFPETVPYCSNELCRWVLGDGIPSSPMKNNDYYSRVFEETEKIMIEYGEVNHGKREVTAVDVEKVAFVLQRNDEIEEFRKPVITGKLLDVAHRLGEGSFGSVYKVQSDLCRGMSTNANFIAIKEIVLDGNEGEKTKVGRHLILKEILVLNQLTELSEEHFVKFLGWNEGSVRRCYYLAMEHVVYGDLESNLGRPGNGELDEKVKWEWSEDSMRTVAKQILQGLQFMHGQLIAHRDLKPQNILVSSLQGGVRVKIADFGVSKRLSKRATTFLRTNIGTGGYKAPEVVRDWERDKGSYSYTADIWSVGCIIYRMASGSALFERETLVANDKRLRDGVKNVKNTLNQTPRGGIHISASGVRFVAALIVVNPEHRPDATRALEALDKWKVDSGDPKRSGSGFSFERLMQSVAQRSKTLLLCH